MRWSSCRIRVVAKLWEFVWEYLRPLIVIKNSQILNKKTSILQDDDLTAGALAACGLYRFDTKHCCVYSKNKLKMWFCISRCNLCMNYLVLLIQFNKVYNSKIKSKCIFQSNTCAKNYQSQYPAWVHWLPPQQFWLIHSEVRCSCSLLCHTPKDGSFLHSATIKPKEKIYKIMNTIYPKHK